jgi:uracil-DNA glycosylase
VKSQYPDEPRSLKKPKVREERRAAVDKPHVRDLNDLVRQIRAERSEESTPFEHESVPFFDPMVGGSKADCLFLFEAPGAKAVDSGFVSRNNDDQTAHNFFDMNEEAKLDRDLTVSWNVVPWALRETGKNRTPKKDEIAEAVQQSLHRLLDIVNPKVVILFGNSAHKAEEVINLWSRQICLIKRNHPSPQNVNPRPEMWGKITAALSRAKSCISRAEE